MGHHVLVNHPLARDHVVDILRRVERLHLRPHFTFAQFTTRDCDNDTAGPISFVVDLVVLQFDRFVFEDCQLVEIDMPG